ncbi:MAG: hypothetical protein H6828_13440 [Planctomycetes bacterium]|nr:hypothetical protein [Planctomycetota bacterium]
MLSRLTTFAAGLALGALFLPRTDLEHEPPLRLALQVGDSSQRVLLDRPFVLELGGERHDARITALPERRFEAHGVRFDYPAEMTYEFEPGRYIQVVTLEGPDSVFMLQFYGPGATPAELAQVLVDGTREQYEGFEVEQEQLELELAGAEREVHRLTVAMGEVAFRQDFVAFELAEGPLVVLLQSNLDDDGELGERAAHALATFSDSFALD